MLQTFFLELWLMHMYWINTSAQIFLVATTSRIPLANKILDEGTVQGARVTFECLLCNEDRNSSPPYA